MDKLSKIPASQETTLYKNQSTFRHLEKSKIRRKGRCFLWRGSESNQNIRFSRFLEGKQRLGRNVGLCEQCTVALFKMASITFFSFHYFIFI